MVPAGRWRRWSITQKKMLDASYGPYSLSSSSAELPKVSRNTVGLDVAGEGRARVVGAEQVDAERGGSVGRLHLPGQPPQFRLVRITLSGLAGERHVRTSWPRRAGRRRSGP